MIEVIVLNIECYEKSYVSYVYWIFFIELVLVSYFNLLLISRLDGLEFSMWVYIIGIVLEYMVLKFGCRLGYYFNVFYINVSLN